jgi:hypothetical protein
VSDYNGNAYELLSQVRYGINEYSTALVQGTDTTGSFLNAELMRHINNAQYFLWSALFGQFPEYFLTSASLVFTASVASLPTDCFKIRDIVDSDGVPIRPIPVNQRHVVDDTGSSNLYYRYGNTLRIDADSITNTGTLWYYSRCRELDTGLTSAGGAASATLATSAKAILSYYNNMRIENITDSTNDTITAYTAARVATVSNTWAASKYYGIISDLPEIFQPLIASRAILTMKMSPRVPIALTRADTEMFQGELRMAMQSFGGTLNGDVDYDSLFNDFG